MGTDLFSKYNPGIRSRKNKNIKIASATSKHIGDIARLQASRNGLKLDEVVKRLEAYWEKAEQRSKTFQAFVALDNSRVVGYGRCEFLKTSIIRGAYGMPEGWYLTGVVVDPNYRRQGIGRQLCAIRLDWIAQYTDRIYYFANAQNKSTIALHHPFGFKEINRDFGLPGLTFHGGEGILFMAILEKNFSLHNSL